MTLADRFAYDPSDSEEIRLEKKSIFIAASACSVAGTIWAAMYAVIFGPGEVAVLPLAFTVIVGSALLVSHQTRNHRYAVHAQIVCIMYVTVGIQWSIGSIFDSGVVILWSFLAPVLALIFYELRAAMAWFGLFWLNLGITVGLDDVLRRHAEPVTPALRVLFFAMNLGIASLVVFAVMGYFVRTATAEHARAERLLLAILPRSIAVRLKARERTIADSASSASVLFADMIGSTQLFSDMSPTEAVSWLNEAFWLFDRLIEKHGLEKIRTIGDNYMAAAGVPVGRADHASALTALALDMIAGVEKIPARNGKRMRFRFGIHSGPLVAGVIGETKFQYDLWGHREHGCPDGVPRRGRSRARERRDPGAHRRRLRVRAARRHRRPRQGADGDVVGRRGAGFPAPCLTAHPGRKSFSRSRRQ